MQEGYRLLRQSDTSPNWAIKHATSVMSKPHEIMGNMLAALLITVITGWACVGCSSTHHTTIVVEPGVIAIPGNQAWTSTGITLNPGENLHIEESTPFLEVFVNGKPRQAVSAKGSYLFNVDTKPFPLEPNREYNDRRYPGYSLIGRIGTKGKPFYVGSDYRGLVKQTGTLWLGINDPDPQQNQGYFACRISQDTPEPSASPPALVSTSASPVTDANVVIIFVDGLRPDVAIEMAEWGHLPNFHELFIKNGSWLPNAFTVQPSLTLTSFASMITGNYSNRHGIKMQCYYDREAEKFINGLDPLYYTRFAKEVKNRQVKTIYDYFPDSFSAAAMPFEPVRPHILQMNKAEWLHRAVNTANYSSNIKSNIDEVQTRFTLDMASSPKVKVMLVWLPSNDVVSETTAHGQFGGARRVIARMDETLGKIVERLKMRGRFKNTYFILLSDHGHAGGNETVNQRFDLAREIFHAWFQMNTIDMWHRFDYPGAPANRLGVMSDADGAVGIFLPRKHVDSRDLSVPNLYETLSNYGLEDGSKINAVERFAEYTAAGHWPDFDTANRPVDFAVAKVDKDTVLVYKTKKSQALIHSRRNAQGVFEFKYQPVKNFTDGQPLQTITTGDPLGYLDNANFRQAAGNVSSWMKDYHTGPEWLRTTFKTEYPACVNTLNLYFRWDGPVNENSPVPSQPDILLFANKGWVFEPHVNLKDRHKRHIGSRHGMAFREATNICLFVSGPGIRQGTVIETPCRMVDIMPTVMEMKGFDPTENTMDGLPIQDIWERR